MPFVETFSHLLPKQMRSGHLLTHGSGNCHFSAAAFYQECLGLCSLQSLYGSINLLGVGAGLTSLLDPWNPSELNTNNNVFLNKPENDLKKTDGLDMSGVHVEMKAGGRWFLRMLRPWVLGKGWIDIRFGFCTCKI